MGRPSKRNEGNDREIVTILKLGYGLQMCADRVGVSRSTIKKWIADDPEFSATIKRARADGKLFVAGELMEAVKKGKAWAICFWLKCRGGPEWDEGTYAPFTMPPTKTVSECNDALSLVAEAAGREEISLEAMDKYSAIVEKKLKGLMDHDIEQQLQEIKEMLSKEDR